MTVSKARSKVRIVHIENWQKQTILEPFSNNAADIVYHSQIAIFPVHKGFNQKPGTEIGTRHNIAVYIPGCQGFSRECQDWVSTVKRLLSETFLVILKQNVQKPNTPSFHIEHAFNFGILNAESQILFIQYDDVDSHMTEYAIQKLITELAIEIRRGEIKRYFVR